MTADDDQDLLAAEYVLGTLDSDERAQARALISVDTAFAGSVRMWERRLGDLCVMVEPVEPPEPVWTAIKAAIGTGEPTAPMQLPGDETAPVEATAPEAPDAVVMGLSRRVGRWRGIAIAACLLAMVMAGYMTAALFAPEFLPDELRPFAIATAPAPSPTQPSGIAPANSPSPATATNDPAKPTGTAGTEAVAVAPPVTGSATPTPPATPSDPAAASRGPAIDRFAAVLQKEPGNAGFVLTLDPQRSRLTVRRIGDAAGQGEAYQLWILSERFPGPRSLGVVGGDDFTVVEGLSAYDRDTLDNATFAVSLEAEGGSATGVAKEPFVFRGKFVPVTPEAWPNPGSQPDAPAEPTSEP